MKTIRFGNLPLLVGIATWMAFFASWILFEETIVDRHGLWRYMAQYHVGRPVSLGCRDGARDHGRTNRRNAVSPEMLSAGRLLTPPRPPSLRDGTMKRPVPTD